MSQSLDGRVSPDRIRAGTPGVLTSDGVRASWQPSSGSGGGGVLGVAEIHMGTRAGVLSTGSGYFPTTNPAITYETGDHAVVASGGDITYADGDAASYYQVNLYMTVTYTANAVSTDTHQFLMEEPLLGDVVMTRVGTDVRGSTVLSGGYALTSETVGSPRLRAYCTGGTDRQYTLEPWWVIVRYSLP